MSDALTEIVCDPSFNVGDVHVHLYPPSIAVFVTFDTVVPSTVTAIVPALTPESVSFTWNSIVGVVFVIYAPADGDVIEIVGAVFSFTRSLSDAPRVI